MKNLIKLFIIGFFLIGLNITTYGANCNNACKIKEETPDILYEYIGDLRTVISNITGKTANVEADDWVVRDYKELKSQVIQLYNNMINWNGYFSYFDFYVVYPISNEYVYEIWRDYNLLNEETKGIEKYKKAIITKGLTNTELSKAEICEGVEDKNCEFEGGKILDVLTQVQKNHERIKEYFRLSILNEKNLFSGEIMLTPSNFKQEFNKYYNENTTSECSSCEGGFFDRIGKAFEDITNLQTVAKDGIKQWKQAISMLDGSISDREYEALERKLLEEELGRQGISGGGADAILNNLDKYNQDAKNNQSWFGYSMENNFISNSFKYVTSSLGKQISDFKEVFLQNFKFGEVEKVSIADIGKTDVNLKTTNAISERISFMYNRELPLAQNQDVEAEKFQSRLIQMHYSLSQAIKVLDKTIEISQKVCNDQAQGRGKCDYGK